MSAPLRPCRACQAQHGGLGGREEHPIPTCWTAVRELGVAWCARLHDLYVCRDCGAVHAVYYDHYQDITRYEGLPCANATWFGEHDPGPTVFGAWLAQSPLRDASVEAGAEVLRTYRSVHPEATQAHAELVLHHLASAPPTTAHAMALLRALIALGNDFCMPSADVLLRECFVAHWEWLPELGRITAAPRRIDMPEPEWKRLCEVCDMDRLIDQMHARMAQALEAADYRALDEQAQIAWKLFGRDFRGRKRDLEQLTQLLDEITALPADTHVPRLNFGAATPQGLAESLARLRARFAYLTRD